MKRKFLIAWLIFILIITTFCNFSSSHSSDILELTCYKGYTAILTNTEILSYKNILLISTVASTSANCRMFLSNDGYFAMAIDSSRLNVKCYDQEGNPATFLCSSSFSGWSQSKFTTAIESLTLSDFTTYSDNSLFISGGTSTGYNASTIFYSDYNVYLLDSEGNLTSDTLYISDNGDFLPTTPVTPEFENPYIINTQEELETGNFDLLKINAGSLDYADDQFIFNIYEGFLFDTDTYNYYIKKSFLLSTDSEYLHTADLNIYYHIPTYKLGLDLTNGKRYMFELKEKGGDTIYNSLEFTVGGLTAEEEFKNAQAETNQKLDEVNETNKGIWETIKDILSYINPFSENFFVYKLIELLIDAIKSLFIPEAGFFDTYFTELKDWFSNRLGFLFYPFEIVIDILNKILNINFSEPIFNIPDINEPFTNTKLISATEFNLNSMLENSVWKNIHDIYLLCLDAFIIFNLINLFRKKYEEVTMS